MWGSGINGESRGKEKKMSLYISAHGHDNNQSAIALACDHQYHAHTKHIDMHYHFICWVIDQGIIQLMYCLTKDMLADVLTKALPSPKVKHFTAGLGLHAK